MKLCDGSMCYIALAGCRSRFSAAASPGGLEAKYKEKLPHSKYLQQNSHHPLRFVVQTMYALPSSRNILSRYFESFLVNDVGARFLHRTY